jgi:hypothetical protein
VVAVEAVEEGAEDEAAVLGVEEESEKLDSTLVAPQDYAVKDAGRSGAPHLIWRRPPRGVSDQARPDDVAYALHIAASFRGPYSSGPVYTSDQSPEQGD